MKKKSALSYELYCTCGLHHTERYGKREENIMQIAIYSCEKIYLLLQIQGLSLLSI